MKNHKALKILNNVDSVRRKLFFIDIDGVLVTPWSFTQNAVFIDDRTDYEPYSKESVLALNMIIDAINPIFVIHSSRRYQYTLENFQTIWKAVGININNISVLERYAEQDDQWFNSPNEEKEYDIKKYIAVHNLSDNDYLILEDEKLALDNLFLLNGNIGLQIKNAERIIKCIYE